MKRTSYLILILTILLAMAFIPAGNVFAQEEPLNVFFDPAPAYLYTSPTNTLVVDVKINNAVNIWSYDVVINYDKDIVKIKSYELVNIFTGEQQCIYQVNNPGFFGLGCTAWSGGLPFDGESAVVRLTFEGVAVGSTPLTFTDLTTFSNKSNVKVPRVRHNGVLTVVDPANFIYLPLIMNVSVQGVLDRGGIDVAFARGLNYGMGTYQGRSTNTTGDNLRIESVVADTYRISTNHPRVLNITPEMNITYLLTEGAEQGPVLRLISGNAVWTDNEINLDDWTAVCGALGDPSKNADADVNFDGFVDARDLVLVAGNFGLSSEVVYAAWNP